MGITNIVLSHHVFMLVDQLNYNIARVINNNEQYINKTEMTQIKLEKFFQNHFYKI